METIKNNENPKMCAKCGGSCCKNYTGSYFPEDLKLKEGELEKNVDILIKIYYHSDYYTIEAELGAPTSLLSLAGDWKNDPNWDWCPNYVVSPSVVEDYGYHKHKCCHLRTAGCNLKFSKRPTLCRSLIPNFNEKTGSNCESKISLKELNEAWEPYQDIIKAILDVSLSKGKFISNFKEEVMKILHIKDLQNPLYIALKNSGF